MKMFDALRKLDGGKELADQLLKVRKIAAPKLDHVVALFPLFTNHSIRHSDDVIKILDWLMPDGIKEKLNKWELYLLLAATYLHDIGMVEGCPGSPEGEEWDEFHRSIEDSDRQQEIYEPTATRE